MNMHPDSLLNNPNLTFSQAINPQTGELIPDRYGNFTRTAETQQLKFSVINSIHHKQTRILIKGSLHKYCKGNNHEDFNIDDLRATIRNLSDLMQTEPEYLIIHQIEFGVNITPAMPTKFFIDQILSHAGKEYELREFNEKGYLKRFRRTQFEVKIYDKGFQYELTDDILRTEIKVTKMDFLHKKGVNIMTVADLLNFAEYPKLKNILNATLQRLIFTDDRIQPKDITSTKDRTLFKEAANPRFWTKLRTIADRMAFSRHLKKIDSIRGKYAPDDLKEIFLQLVANKWDFLFDNVTFLPLTKNDELLRYDTHIVCNNVTPAPRYCLTCGRDITAQKTGSQYCSEKIYGPEVKSCRNEVSNFKKRENGYYPGATLFNIDEMLKPEYLRLKKIAFKHS